MECCASSSLNTGAWRPPRAHPRTAPGRRQYAMQTNAGGIGARMVQVHAGQLPPPPSGEVGHRTKDDPTQNKRNSVRTAGIPPDRRSNSPEGRGRYVEDERGTPGGSRRGAGAGRGGSRRDPRGTDSTAGGSRPPPRSRCGALGKGEGGRTEDRTLPTIYAGRQMSGPPPILGEPVRLSHRMHGSDSMSSDAMEDCQSVEDIR